MEPHDGKGLQHLLEKVSDGETIGKVRVHKSGKVTMKLEAGGKFMDFDLSCGIQANFYQELISLDSSSR
jgi:hypothetical protein